MDNIPFAENILAILKKRGADEADVFLTEYTVFSLDTKDGEIERLEQSKSKGMGLRIFKDKKLAFGATTDYTEKSMTRLIDELFSLVKVTERDEFNGIPEKMERTTDVKALQLFDPDLEKIPVSTKIEMVQKMEQAAKQTDSRIKAFRRSSYTDYGGSALLVNSNGTVLKSRGTYYSLSCAPSAEENNEKQVDYWYSAKRFFTDLDTPESIGKKAAERTLARLGSRPVKSQKVPVIFSPEIGKSFLDLIASAIKANSIWYKSSFLTDRLGDKVGSDLFTLIDDPLIPRGLSSDYFDGDGNKTQINWLFQDGVLRNYLYDEYYARKMGAVSTGSATRRYDSTPYIETSNLYLMPGTDSPEDIISDVQNGLYLTGTMGSGLNRTTGDFSYGATGFWITNGKIDHPVSQITIAGSMLDLMASIDAVANDLDQRSGTFAPTFRVKELTISGS